MIKPKKLKTSTISFLIMLGVILALFGLYMLMAYYMEDSLTAGARTPEEQAAEIAAERDFFPKMDRLYEAGDYDSLIDLANSKEAKSVDLWNYGHYDFLRFYGKYKDIRDIYIPALDGGELSQDLARKLTENTFEYYYKCYDPNIMRSVKMTDKDITYFDSIRDDYILDILYNRMGYTKNDMDAAKDDIINSNYFHSITADKYSDKYFGRYR